MNKFILAVSFTGMIACILSTLLHFPNFTAMSTWLLMFALNFMIFTITLSIERG